MYDHAWQELAVFVAAGMTFGLGALIAWGKLSARRKAKAEKPIAVRSGSLANARAQAQARWGWTFDEEDDEVLARALAMIAAGRRLVGLGFDPDDERSVYDQEAEQDLRAEVIRYAGSVN